MLRYRPACQQSRHGFPFTRLLTSPTTNAPEPIPVISPEPQASACAALQTRDRPWPRQSAIRIPSAGTGSQRQCTVHVILMENVATAGRESRLHGDVCGSESPFRASSRIAHNHMSRIPIPVTCLGRVEPGGGTTELGPERTSRLRFTPTRYEPIHHTQKHKKTPLSKRGSKAFRQ